MDGRASSTTTASPPHCTSDVPVGGCDAVVRAVARSFDRGWVADDPYSARQLPPIASEDYVRFLMLVCRDESIAFGPDERAAIGPAVEAWVAEMEQRGVRLLGDVLAPVDDTAVVRLGRRGHRRAGPRVETTEPVSGFNLLECADVDEAVEVSARHPIVRFGTIELRPITV